MLKTLSHGHMLLVILMVKKLSEHFMKKNCQKQEEFRIEKVIKKKVDKLYHCVKNVQIQSYFWSVFSCIWTEYRKIRTRNNSALRHFHSVYVKWKGYDNSFNSWIDKRDVI